MSVNEKEWQPRILGFACNWCSYAGADVCGVSRFQHPSTMRIVRVPCSGRVKPEFVLRAFQRGIDGVLVGGWHPGDCHYVSGNYYTRRRYLVMKRLLEYVGYDPGRFNARWISGSEGLKWAENTKEMTEKIKALGPNKRFEK